MPHTGWLWEVLSWMSLPVLAVLAGILVSRKLQHEFPFFFWYLIATEIGTAVRFVAQFGSGLTYFYAYWTSDLGITIFNFLAIYELIARRLFPGFQQVRLYRYLFPVASSAIIVLGWLIALEAPAKNTAFLIEARVLSFILAAILAFFISLMLVMGRSWTRYDFGIAFGFALTNATFLIGMLARARSRYGPTSIDQLPLIAFDATCLIWLFAFWKPARRTELLSAESLDPALLRQAREWEGTLKNWLALGKRRS
jgi:hypothetical protein